VYKIFASTGIRTRDLQLENRSGTLLLLNIKLKLQNKTYAATKLNVKNKLGTLFACKN